MLTPAGCQARQARLLRQMEQTGYDLFFTGNRRTVYYLTGSLSSPDAPTAFLLTADGLGTLFCASPGEWTANEQIPLETYSIQRSIDFPQHDLARLVADALSSLAPKRSAVERAGTNGLLEALFDDPVDASTLILRLRKRKEPDEIAEIQASLRLCAVAYDAARTAIQPGRTELDVYGEMYRAVTQAAGTAVPFPGDFACGTRAIRGGGPPTTRQLQSGDLYILDLFPEPALYFGDTCRTFAVTEPTRLQEDAYDLVRQALQIGEQAIRPGIPAREVYRTIKTVLDSHELTEQSFWHHAGHGIGHHGHEAPRFIPGSEDVVQVGDVFTLEPGVYTQALQGGIRLEDNYVLTESGIVNLFHYPMKL